MTRVEAVEIPQERAAPDPGRHSVGGLCQLFWDIEKRHDLASLRSGDVHPWPLIRMNLYYALTERIGLFDAAHPALKSSRKRHPHSLSTIQRHFGLRLAARRDRMAGRARYVVLGNGRRIKGIEPYTEALLKEIGTQSLLIEPQANASAYAAAWDYRALVQSFRSSRSKRKAVNDPVLCGVSAAIATEFAAALDTEIPDIHAMMSRAIRNFRDEREGFTRLFRRNNTKALYLLNAYSRPAAVAAARSLGCQVVELQHGFISRYHLGYSWPGRPHIPYAPDELWCFGPAWCQGMDLPAGVATRSIGAPYLERAIARSDETDERLVVFTSQGVLGRKLFDNAIEVAALRPRLDIVFRLHPNEILDSYRDELAARPVIPPNFSLSHKDPSIFDLLSRARFQVGSFSTTLIEGMAVGASPVVLRMPGCEYMEEIVKSGDAQFAESINDILAALDGEVGKPAFRQYYAVPEKQLVEG